MDHRSHVATAFVWEIEFTRVIVSMSFGVRRRGKPNPDSTILLEHDDLLVHGRTYTIGVSTFHFSLQDFSGQPYQPGH